MKKYKFKNEYVIIYDEEGYISINLNKKFSFNVNKLVDQKLNISSDNFKVLFLKDNDIFNYVWVFYSDINIEDKTLNTNEYLYSVLSEVDAKIIEVNLEDKDLKILLQSKKANS